MTTTTLPNVTLTTQANVYFDGKCVSHGFTLADGGMRLVVVSVLDNLLKGAATQAMQNLNLAFGFDEVEGIPMEAAA